MQVSSLCFHKPLSHSPAPSPRRRCRRGPGVKRTSTYAAASSSLPSQSSSHSLPPHTTLSPSPCTLSSQEMQEGPWSQQNVDPGGSPIIASVPNFLTPPSSSSRSPSPCTLTSQEKQEGPWSQQNVDPGSGLVITFLCLTCAHCCASSFTCAHSLLPYLLATSTTGGAGVALEPTEC